MRQFPADVLKLAISMSGQLRLCIAFTTDMGDLEFGEQHGQAGADCLVDFCRPKAAAHHQDHRFFLIKPAEFPCFGRIAVQE